MVVSDSGFRDTASTDPEDRTVDIVAGGRVNFSYPSGTGEYNVVWDRGSLEPASCEQTAGPVWGYGTTLPWWTQGPGWAGYCTFTLPGTYTFHSGVNPNGVQGHRRRARDGDAHRDADRHGDADRDADDHGRPDHGPRSPRTTTGSRTPRAPAPATAR